MITRADYKDFTFHDAATTAANGNPLTLDGWEKQLTVEVYGSEDNTARTVTFYGVGSSGTKRALAGTKISAAPLTVAVNTTGTGELWQFDITGLTSVIMDLTAITGGSVSVKGRAVS